MLRIALAFVFIVYFAAASDAAESPCEVLAAGTFPAPDQAPLIRVWTFADAPQPIAATTCAGLDDARLAVTMRGSFRFDGSRDDLLARVGAVSSLARLRYWSTTEKKWLPLITFAQALSAPDPMAVRGDFSAAELKTGAEHEYLQQDNRSSRAVVYRLRVTLTGRDRVEIDSENVSPVRWLLVTLFPPGTVSRHVRLQRMSPGVWGIAQLDSVGRGASLLASGHDASYVNRTAAFFRHLAGVPTGEDPPAAP